MDKYIDRSISFILAIGLSLYFSWLFNSCQREKAVERTRIGDEVRRKLEPLLQEQPTYHQENVFGNKQREVFIEYRNVRYFSHVDGKEISDLVK